MVGVLQTLDQIAVERSSTKAATRMVNPSQITGLRI